MKYLHLFENKSDFNTEYNGTNYIEPWVSLTKSIEKVDYNKPDYTKVPFTVEALGSGNITWEELGTKTLQYSKNGGSWETMNNTTTIPVIEGDEVQFKGTNNYYSECIISVTTQFNVKGNIMSIIAGDNFKTTKDFGNISSVFWRFFYETNVVSARNLKLPVTTLSPECYMEMFALCKSLTEAPELLPAMNLTNDCYNMMFTDCDKLKTAPILPAITLTECCYDSMFSGCTSLNYVKAMFTTTPSDDYTNGWLSGVASTGTFVKSSAATWNVTGDNGIPNGWTVETATS